MDMAEKLAFIDEHYLSAFERLDVDSEIRKQEPFEKRKGIWLWNIQFQKARAKREILSCLQHRSGETLLTSLQEQPLRFWIMHF